MSNNIRLQQRSKRFVVTVAAVIIIAGGVGAFVVGKSYAGTCVSSQYTLGSKGLCVKYMQQMLNTAAKNWGNLYYAAQPNGEQIVANGTFELSTRERILLFQKVSPPTPVSLKQSGVMDNNTWRELCSVVKDGTGLASWQPGYAAGHLAGCY